MTAAVPGQLSPEDLCRLLEVDFTGEQLAAASAPLEPCVVVAGAGSGKTSVMAARVVWLVATGQVRPDQVLGLTFTNKAAGELAGRINDALRRAGLTPEPMADSAGEGTLAAGTYLEPGVSTYHAYAQRLVVEHGLRIGVEPRSRLLVDATRFQLAARVLRDAKGPIRHVTRPMRMLIGDLVTLESELAEHLVSTEAVRDHDRKLIEIIDADDEAKPEVRKITTVARQRLEMLDLVDGFRARKRSLDLIDFADQVALGARLASECPAVGAIERDRYRVVLLDEYQDTSVGQRCLLSGLFGGGHPVTAVGDPCQAIYGWRGASVGNLDRFPSDFPTSAGRPAAVRLLSVNQRSGGLLLRLANAVAATLRKVHRIAELQPRADRAEAGDTIVALHHTYADEMAWMAGRVRAAVDAGTPPGEVAVLVRVRSDYPAVYAALLAEGLPVEVVGLGGLLSLPEVADLVAVLSVLDDPTSNAELVRLLTGPRWRIGPRDLVTLGRRAQELVRETSGSSPAGGTGPVVEPSMLDEDDSALEDAVAGIDPCDVVALADALDRPGRGPWSAEALERLTAMGRELRELRGHLGQPLLDVLHRVITATDLDVELAASSGAVQARRRESLAAFLDVAADFVDLDGEASLTSFLAYLRAAALYERGLDTISPSGADAVQVLTAHKAKGLEWDVVVVPDLVKSVFPGDRLRDQWTTSAWVLPYRLRGDAADMPACADWTKDGLVAFEKDCREHLEREERRLGYVAFTRARHTMIGSGHWWGPTQKKPRGPSPFLEELRQHCVAGHGVMAGWSDQPAEGGGNPALQQAVRLDWPLALEPTALRLREEAAAAVRADLAALAAGVPLPDVADLSHGECRLLADLDADAELLLQEDRAADVPVVREVTLPATLSASQLVRLHEDPAALARALARPLPYRPVPQARRGTRFHAWVEAEFGQRPLLDLDELPGAEDDGLGTDAELVALQRAFEGSAYAARQPFQLEAPFELSLAGRLVRGRIDAVYDLGDGRWEVVDWKTGKEPAHPLQLAIYRLAWAGLRACDLTDVVATFFYVRTGEISRPADLPDADALGRLLTGDGG